MATSVGSYRRFTQEIVNLPNHNFKYLLKDYGNYRTISKVILTDGKIESSKKVEEYVYWRNESQPGLEK